MKSLFVSACGVLRKKMFCVFKFFRVRVRVHRRSTVIVCSFMFLLTPSFIEKALVFFLVLVPDLFCFVFCNEVLRMDVCICACSLCLEKGKRDSSRRIHAKLAKV